MQHLYISPNYNYTKKEKNGLKKKNKMSLEKLKNTDATKIPPGKLISMISKESHLYFNHKLEPLGISANLMHILFEVKNQKEINQEKIAKACSINKGAVTRSITKLKDKNLIKRETDENNRRQNIITLTEKGEKTYKECVKILYQYEKDLFNELNKEEKEIFQKILKNTAIRINEINQKEKKG